MSGCRGSGVAAAHHGDGLVDGDDAVALVLGPQLLGRRREREAGGVGVALVPGGVAAHVVHEVRAELLPRLVEVVGDEEGLGRVRVGDAGTCPARGPRRVPPPRRRPATTSPPPWAKKPMPLRPARRAAATLPPPQATIGPPGVSGGGVTWMRRPSCSKGSPVLAFSRIDELLVGDLAPPVVVDPEHLVLDRAVADRGHVADPAAADDVEHRTSPRPAGTGSWSGSSTTATLIIIVVVRAAMALASVSGAGR